MLPSLACPERIARSGLKAVMLSIQRIMLMELSIIAPSSGTKQFSVIETQFETREHSDV